MKRFFLMLLLVAGMARADCPSTGTLKYEIDLDNKTAYVTPLPTGLWTGFPRGSWESAKLRVFWTTRIDSIIGTVQIQSFVTITDIDQQTCLGVNYAWTDFTFSRAGVQRLKEGMATGTRLKLFTWSGLNPGPVKRSCESIDFSRGALTILSSSNCDGVPIRKSVVLSASVTSLPGGVLTEANTACEGYGCAGLEINYTARLATVVLLPTTLVNCAGACTPVCLTSQMTGISVKAAESPTDFHIGVNFNCDALWMGHPDYFGAARPYPADSYDLCGIHWMPQDQSQFGGLNEDCYGTGVRTKVNELLSTHVPVRIPFGTWMPGNWSNTFNGNTQYPPGYVAHGPSCLGIAFGVRADVVLPTGLECAGLPYKPFQWKMSFIREVVNETPNPIRVEMPSQDVALGDSVYIPIDVYCDARFGQFIQGYGSEYPIWNFLVDYDTSYLTFEHAKSGAAVPVTASSVQTSEYSSCTSLQAGHHLVRTYHTVPIGPPNPRVTANPARTVLLVFTAIQAGPTRVNFWPYATASCSTVPWGVSIVPGTVWDDVTANLETGRTIWKDTLFGPGRPGFGIYDACIQIGSGSGCVSGAHPVSHKCRKCNFIEA